MSSLVEKLRGAAAILPHEVFGWLNPLMLEAANELERLEESLLESWSEDHRSD